MRTRVIPVLICLASVAMCQDHPPSPPYRFNMGRVVAALAALAVAWVGLACILRPAMIQDYVLRTQSNKWAWRINPFADWMKGPAYRTFLQFMGAFMLLWAA